MSLLLLTALACTPEGPAPSPPIDPPTASAPAGAQESPSGAPSRQLAEAPVTYTLSFDDRDNHMLDVRVDTPTSGADPLIVWMPTWTPGSYLIREYARHVEDIQARAPDGSVLQIERVTKNRWSIATGGADAVAITYRLYAKEPSVRTNFIDGDLAILNGASTFLTPLEDVTRPHRVVATLPAEWRGGYTGLTPTPGGGPADWTAESLDELIDSPIVFGSPTVRDLDVPGVPHQLVLAGDLGPWDVDQSTDDVAAIVRAQQALWGDVPYDHYVFLNVVNERRGGLEHLDSTLMMSSRWNTTLRQDYVKWLGLVSHEFFHTWNVKRLRPAPLGPFDYENEVYTPSLWVAEGLTSYYDDLVLMRAGLITEKEYLARISDQLKGVQDTPGRLTQTLHQASSDAWVKHYRHDENTVNTAISYYTKGLLVGWLLDAQVRNATDGARSLDDVMRLAYDRYRGDTGYTPAQFEQVIDDVAGVPLDDFLDHALRTTKELDYAPALAHFGLRFADPDAEPPVKEGEPAPPPEPKDADPAWLGAKTDATKARLIIEEIKRGTPAHDAGIQVGDELIAIDGWRVPRDGQGALLKKLRPGAVVPVTVSRNNKLLTVDVTLSEKPKDRWKLEVDPDATPEAVARRRAWLGQPPTPPAEPNEP